MNGLIVAVWGNSGAGKTSVSAAIAWALCKKLGIKSPYTMLVCNDRFVPALGLLMPEVEIDPKIKSISDLLMMPEFTTDDIWNNIVIHPAADNLCIMGNKKEDQASRFGDGDDNAARRFIRAARDTMAVTVIDCGNPLEDILSYQALREADIIISLLEPDTKGVMFYKSMQDYFQLCYESAKINILALSYTHYTTIAPENSIEKIIDRHVDMAIPYSFEEHQRCIEGKLFSDYKFDSKKYCFNSAISDIADVVVKEVKD
jgi:CO dehydrogenase nickel-insertion accessory protein CooC1